jgi:ABC-type arginine transport system permease subunit
MPALWDLGVARIGRYFLPALASCWLALLLCGSLLVFVGLLDHLQLARVLKPAMKGQS